MGRDNPHEWFTAGEVADLASRFGIERFPASKRGVNKWLRRQEIADPDGFGQRALKLSRTRTGQMGGGGKEYHRLLFRSAGKAIATAMKSEVQKRLAEAAPPGEIIDEFDQADIRLMAVAIGITEGYGALRLERLKPYIVHRKHIRAGGHRFYIGKGLDGQTVLVSKSKHPMEHNVHLAFLWRFNPVHGGLLAHGKAGFIGVAEADPEPEPDWGRLLEAARLSRPQ